MLYYAGNLTLAQDLFKDAPLNTDDRPNIEFNAPVSHRARKAGKQQFFGGSGVLEFLQLVQQKVPVVSDPFLAAVPEAQRALSRAGFDLHASIILQSLGHASRATQARNRFRRTWEDEALWAERTEQRNAGI